MPRDIADFTGNNAVIGCSAQHRLCAGSHHPAKHYYSIDMDSTVKPDFKFNILDQLPETFNGRFQITYTENLDAFAYNVPYRRNEALPAEEPISQGFKNLFNMTHIDGFIVLSGCPRLKE